MQFEIHIDFPMDSPLPLEDVAHAAGELLAIAQEDSNEVPNIEHLLPDILVSGHSIAAMIAELQVIIKLNNCQCVFFSKYCCAEPQSGNKWRVYSNVANHYFEVQCDR